MNLYEITFLQRTIEKNTNVLHIVFIINYAKLKFDNYQLVVTFIYIYIFDIIQKVNQKNMASTSLIHMLYN